MPSTPRPRHQVAAQAPARRGNRSCHGRKTRRRAVVGARTVPPTAATSTTSGARLGRAARGWPTRPRRRAPLRRSRVGARGPGFHKPAGGTGTSLIGCAACSRRPAGRRAAPPSRPASVRSSRARSSTVSHTVNAAHKGTAGTPPVDQGHGAIISERPGGWTGTSTSGFGASRVGQWQQRRRNVGPVELAAAARCR